MLHVLFPSYQRQLRFPGEDNLVGIQLGSHNVGICNKQVSLPIDLLITTHPSLCNKGLSI